ncbi:hypothetical protein [Bacillus suaedaesalsae]|uniref:Uncharacterized protein n=1 Tax=Bacillus suaedaesalsae TaxID=2810349 RepID=A0ABS2DM76_9BACI|nr:hypothetical protein [Bacillus suaedaesalsae]MBM6619452.1 hypothetical protein [Bacillus suaedaesalsae]
MKAEMYLIVLLAISFLFFWIVASIVTTSSPYTDILLTIAVVHFVLFKIIDIKKIDMN